MAGFKLTEEQIALQTVCKEFAEKEIKPVSLERDAIADPAKCISWEVLDKAAEIGLKTMTLKKQLGGAEIGSLDMVVYGEELCIGDMGIGGTIVHSWWKIPYVIQRIANEEQIRDYLIPYFRDHPRGLCGLALTEPEAGSDHFWPCDDPKAGAKLAAVKDGDHVVINGMKHYLTLGNEATLWVVWTRTDKTVPYPLGMTAFLVPIDTPGLSVGNVHDKMGGRSAPNAELIFDNVRVPLTAQIGDWNTGMAQLGRTLPSSNATTAVIMLAGARAALEMAIDYAKQRVQGGKIIFEHQAVQLRLAEIWTNLHAARLMIWHTCATWDEIIASGFKDPIDIKMFKAPKLFVSKVTREAVLEAQLIMGALGIDRGVGMEKLVRDVLTLRHPDGTDDVLRLAVAHYL